MYYYYSLLLIVIHYYRRVSGIHKNATEVFTIINKILHIYICRYVGRRIIKNKKLVLIQCRNSVESIKNNGIHNIRS